MTPAALTGYVAVPVFGALMCAAPAFTQPTLQFGVRIPPAHSGAAVIRRERRTYYWRSAAVAVCCAAAAIIFWRSGSRWLPRIILLLEVAADIGCIWLARRKIIAAKTAEGWYAGLRQTVVADTRWRTQPQPFPLRWLIPATGVIAATIVIGTIRYPHLPAHLAAGLATLGGRRVPRSPVSAFALVIAQLFVTGMWTGLPSQAAWQHLGIRNGFEVVFLRAWDSGCLIRGCTTAIEDGTPWSVEYAIELDSGGLPVAPGSAASRQLGPVRPCWRPTASAAGWSTVSQRPS
jgi:uncharacterized membrane protein